MDCANAARYRILVTKTKSDSQKTLEFKIFFLVFRILLVLGFLIFLLMSDWAKPVISS